MEPLSEFEKLVVEAVEGLPPDLLAHMDNVDVMVQGEPTLEQLRSVGVLSPGMLLGLYSGVPLTHRQRSYGMVLPDKIILFQTSIEAICSTEETLVQKVREVVAHEVAHHFGIGDKWLQALEASRNHVQENKARS